MFEPLLGQLLPRGAAAVAGGTAWWAATLLLPSLALTLALVVDDLGLAVGLLGSLLGGAIMYVVPPAIHATQILGAAAAAGASEGGARSGLGLGSKLALGVDALLVLYGVGGQMVVGTLITYRHALRGSDRVRL